jgi:hypothetical protein
MGTAEAPYGGLQSISRDNALLRGFLRENPGAKETKRNLKERTERIASI